jgi:CRP-like cAMP-binding protein
MAGYPALAAGDMSSIAPPPALGEALLQSIAARGGVRRYPGQAVIATEGDTSDQLFIILTGRVKVYTGSCPSAWCKSTARKS